MLHHVDKNRAGLRSRLALACLAILATNAATTLYAAGEPAFDWSAWRSLPVLDDGRIKPLDTYADEKVTLVTGRAGWTDPKTKHKYVAAELLYHWLLAPDDWLRQPIIRCEYRPLRKLLGVEVEGAFVAVSDVIDWEKERPVYRSPELEKILGKLDAASQRGMKRPAETGDTPAERDLNSKAAELFRHVQTFLAAREGRGLFVVPGLDPRSLMQQTNPDEKTRPWVSLGGLLRLDKWEEDGDPTLAALMAPDPQKLLLVLLDDWGYPRDHIIQLAQAQKLQPQLRPLLEAIRPAFDQTRRDLRGDSGRGPNDFARSMRIFVGKVRELGEALSQARLKMAPPDVRPDGMPDQIWKSYVPLDAAQMQLSAYPPAGGTDLEVFYNRVQPFYLACWFFAVATAVIVASLMVKAQRTVYGVGLMLAAAAIAVATWGFTLRIAVAGRPPVTNMYETVIWVSYVVAVLGFALGLSPQAAPGLKWSWRLAAVPFTWEAAPLFEDDRRKLGASAIAAFGAVLGLLRIAGFTALIWFLTQSDTSYRISSLKPPISAVHTVAFESLMTWLLGLTASALAAWYLPRVAITLCLAPVMILSERRRLRRSFWDGVLENRFFLVGSMSVSTLGLLLAYQVGLHSPDILNPGIGSIAAVLRNNYWLTIHVLTIVSSYGAGALTWGLGNLAMLYYLFGRYRTVHRRVTTDEHRPTVSDGDEPAVEATGDEPADSFMSRLGVAGRGLAPGRISRTLKAGFHEAGAGDAHLEVAAVRPPPETTTLANFGYKGMQVAVLLLAAGTILGGLWADVSWGRFWDWDPKEVWALISLLCYLVFLHGRYAGWVGTFGTNLGSVLCFQAILMSWYGVNFVLPMIHGWWNGTNTPTSVGMHSYATGAGGLEWVIGAVVLNLALVAAAWARYVGETLQATPAGAKQSTTPPATRVAQTSGDEAGR